MARLLTAGAEANDTVIDGMTGVGANWAMQAAVVRSGAFAWSTFSNSSGTFGFAAAVGDTVYVRVYLRFTQLGSGAVNVMSIRTAAAAVLCRLQLQTNGTVTLIAGTSTLVGSASAEALTPDTWHMLELAWKAGAGAADYVEGRLNGVSIASTTTANVSDVAAADVIFVGPAVGEGTFYFDDLGVNDSTGASQTSWPGSGKVVLLKPTGDVVDGTGWTLGTGTALAANAFDSLNNLPPVGVADLAVGSDPKQIRNATANANVNVDVNLTDYQTAGIRSQDTINVLTPFVVTAAPVSTSAKAGTVGVASNPVIANVALGAGGTPGAFWSGVAAGAYSTGWKTSFGTITYSPAVVKTTPPVMRITQVTSSTRIAMVCSMGMYVDYTPGPDESYIASLGRRPVPMIQGPDTDQILRLYRDA